jgi:hypothetical protein
MTNPIVTEAQHMIAPQFLIDSLQTNYNVIHRQVKGLTHEESLLQLPFRGNCLNWVIGHIIWRRNTMLEMLDKPTIWTEEQQARYARESQPVTSGEDAMHFDQLMADFGKAQELLVQALQETTAEALAGTSKVLIPNAPAQSAAEWVHFLVWHETYHVGQTELLRQLTGVNDKVI